MDSPFHINKWMLYCIFIQFNTQQVLDFMKNVVPWLEQQEFVAGYAWFDYSLLPTDAVGTTSALYDGITSLELTALGRFYASVTTSNPMGNQSIAVAV
jgi:Glycosyl hydrolase catalytic core